MLFSCKISHSVLGFVDRRGEDLESVYEQIDLPAEFLKDPSYWLEADKMESLLQLLQQGFRHLAREENPVQEAGHGCKEQRAWGVLDSVLRMVQSPQDIFSQPERFLSYFISPAPPVGNVVRGAEHVSFELPISASEYPNVTEYLRCALEALPTYANKPMAVVTWEDTRITVHWSESQASLFGEGDVGEHRLNPELLRTILQNLEDTQKQLEFTNRQLLLKNQELDHAKSELERLDHLSPHPTPAAAAEGYPELAASLGQEMNQPLAGVLNDLYRLNDYMARAQQLITLLVGQGRNTPQVQEAMRRVDWPHVQAETPNVVQGASRNIKRLQTLLKDFAFVSRVQSPTDEPKVASDLNRLVSGAIQSVTSTAGKEIHFEKQLHLDRDVTVYPGRMQQALVNILSSAVQGRNGPGIVKVVTRPKGHRAEIEISEGGNGSRDLHSGNMTLTPADPVSRIGDPGSGWTHGLSLSIAHSIVRMHDGSLSVSGQPGGGSTFIVDLPL